MSGFSLTFRATDHSGRNSEMLGGRIIPLSPGRTRTSYQTKGVESGGASR
jgi:hypothetical protein